MAVICNLDIWNIWHPQTVLNGQSYVLCLDRVLTTTCRLHQIQVGSKFFGGPSLSCYDVEKDLYDKVIKQVSSVVKQASSVYDADGPIYMSWLPSNDSEPDSLLPYNKANTNHPFTVKGGPYGISNNQVASAGGLMTQFFAALDLSANEPNNITTGTGTILRCAVQNTSYITNFSYVNGLQSIRVSHEPHNYVSWDLQARGNSLPVNETLSYAGILDSFAKTVVGFSVLKDKGRDSSNVKGTAFMNTKEIKSLREKYHIQETISEEAAPLRTVVEKAFENATMSLISSPSVQYVLSPFPYSFLYFSLATVFDQSDFLSLLNFQASDSKRRRCEHHNI